MADLDKEFLDYVVKSLVDNPDKVETDRRVDEMGVLLTLKVAPEDMGKIIGRKGQTVTSVRTLLRVIGAKNNARVNLKIIEPEGSTHQRSEEETSTSDVAGDDIVDDLKI